VCAVLLPGTTIDWKGLLIAIAVMDLPVIGTDRYLDRVVRPRHPGLFALGGCLIVVWVFVGPAIADWVTPHFNIGGAWQYVVLVVVNFGLGFAYWKILTIVAPVPDLD
jgi:hypothetical protein